MQKVYMLICENAGSLGGPMGSEHTDFMWVKLFSDRDKAKTYAEKYVKKPEDEVRWEERSRTITWDSGPYYFTIKEEKIL